MNPYMHSRTTPNSFGESSSHTMTFASYQRIVQGMLASGELRISSDEYVSSVVVEENGLAFIIERKEG